MKLLKHGVFLSNQAAPVTRGEALVLVAQAMLDNYVREFRSLLLELVPECHLERYRASTEEVRAWFGQEAYSEAKAEDTPAEECPSRGEGISSYSSICKEVDEKMKFDMQSKLDEYLRLLEQIKQKTTDERTAMSLLQEVCKDRRSAEIREERETKSSDNSNNDSIPATEKQKQFMKKLGIKFPATVTKQEASTLIDEKREQNGE